VGLASTDITALKPQVLKPRTRSKRTKLGIKSTSTAIYSGIFLLVIAVVAIGYQPPKQVDSTVNAAAPISSPTSTAIGQPSVDQIVATNIAAGIAERADLPVATNIANQAVSLSIQNQLAQQTDSSTVNKPLIITPSADSRALKEYVVKTGDTTSSIAAQFGLSADTVKWANDLSSDSVTVGKTLTILPVDGVLYTVKGGDTIDSIASKFGTSAQNITVYNDLELSGLVPGNRIVLPSGVVPTTERPGYVAPYSYVSSGYAYGTIRFAGGYGGGYLQIINPYDYISHNIYSWGNGGANGQCTWWAIERRAAMGIPLPGGALGNAAEWAYTLGRAGYAVNSTPARGAVIQNGGGYGHVGVVESVNGDGSITITEMNNYTAGGAFHVDLRTIPASAVGNFNYIH
jgi:surface antigen/LysM repeat protein